MVKKVMTALGLCLALAACSGPLTQQDAVLADGTTYRSNQFKAAGVFGSDEWCTARGVDHENKVVEFYPNCHAGTGDIAGATTAVTNAVSAAGNLAGGIGFLKEGFAAGKSGSGSGGGANVTVYSNATATNNK